MEAGSRLPAPSRVFDVTACPVAIVIRRPFCQGHMRTVLEYIDRAGTSFHLRPLLGTVSYFVRMLSPLYVKQIPVRSSLQLLSRTSQTYDSKRCSRDYRTRTES